MTATIVRPMRGRMRVHGLRGPRGDEPTNRTMFKTATGKAIRPEWIPAAEGDPGWKGHWEIAREHLTVVAEEIALRDGRVIIEMHYSTTEQCDARCQRAEGDECTCACEGKYHGNGHHASWMEVGDTTLIHNAGEKVVVRELTSGQARLDREERLNAYIQGLQREQ